jgi:hypothetical protein
MCEKSRSYASAIARAIASSRGSANAGGSCRSCAPAQRSRSSAGAEVKVPRSRRPGTSPLGSARRMRTLLAGAVMCEERAPDQAKGAGRSGWADRAENAITCDASPSSRAVILADPCVHGKAS